MTDLMVYYHSIPKQRLWSIYWHVDYFNRHLNASNDYHTIPTIIVGTMS